MNGHLVRWNKAKIHVLSHALHYGSAVFEGIRVYMTERGPAIFRLKDHVKRLLYSARSLQMKVPYSVSEMSNAILRTVKKNKLKQGYIRPLIFYGYGKMGLNPKACPIEISIACWPWGKYLANRPLRVQISDIVRIHPRSSITDAKISGHYVNSIMAVKHLGKGYDEALLLDYLGNIAEGPGENFFLIKKKTLYTPKLGTILAGITRKTVFEIAKDLGYKIVEKLIKPKELSSADEAFFTGTAAEICAIGSIDGGEIGTGKMGQVTASIQSSYMNAVHGRTKKYDKCLSYIS